MKKLILLSFLVVIQLSASSLTSLFKNSDHLGKSHGGDMHDIDAYSDGIGVIIHNFGSENIVDMTKFNKTVLEKGVIAKELNKSILDLYPDATEKIRLSGDLSKTFQVIIGPKTGSNGNTITEIEVYNFKNESPND